MTLLSIKNSLKYFRTSPVEVLSGVPKLTNKTPTLDLILFIGGGVITKNSFIGWKEHRNLEATFFLF